MIEHVEMPTKDAMKRAFKGLKAADMALEKTVPIEWALTFLDAYLATGMKLKALDENT